MPRSLLLLLLCVTAAAVTIWLFPKPSPNAVGFTNNVAEVDALLEGRAGSGEHFDAQIPRADAETLFKTDPTRFVWDPYCYYVYKPGLVETRRWKEHPERYWERRINPRGLREEGDPRLTDAALGVLVTGDSHTDGACGNDETFAALLEKQLEAREVDVEVLNTGVVGYSFYNYLGVLRRFLALDEIPDVFVVCVYGGNDFVEVLRPHHYLRGTTPPVRRTGYWARIDQAKQVSSSFLAQTLSQVVFFQEHPSEFEVALDGARAALSRIVDTCRAQDIRLVVTWLPPAWEVGGPTVDGIRDQALQALSLDESDLFVSRRLRERFFELADQLGVHVIDLTPALVAEARPCYWERDMHINLVGHQVVARVLEEHLLSGGGELGPVAALVRPDGPTEERDRAGRLLARGAWKDGLREGEWVHFYPYGDERCRGTWRAGARTGEWTWRYEGGGLQQQGEFVEDQRQGRWREWWRDGGLRREGTYDAGRPAGRWVDYHEGGGVASEGSFAAGVRTGAWVLHHQGGALESRLAYASGKLEGAAMRCYSDGQVEWQGAYTAGKRSGAWIFYRPGGQKASEGSYADGQRVGAWTFWDEEGAVDEQRSGTYLSGERTGD